MDIFKIETSGCLHIIYKAILRKGVITEWIYVDETTYNFQAYRYVRENGREFDPNRDKVSWLASYL